MVLVRGMKSQIHSNKSHCDRTPTFNCAAKLRRYFELRNRFEISQIAQKCSTESNGNQRNETERKCELNLESFFLLVLMKNEGAPAVNADTPVQLKGVREML